ncbi:unknown [Proteobacteria bacterium CAG:139]|nr:unknown [Proteobacteria bacterium CAG:139]
MCRTVFTDTDGVVCKDEDRAQLHQCGHSQCIAAVVCEGKEGSAVRDESAVQSDAVQDGAHAEFTDTVVNMASEISIGSHGLNPFPVGQVGACEVSRAAEQFGQMRCVSVQSHLAGLAGRDCLGFAGCIDDGFKNHIIPVFRQLAFHAAF